MEGQYFVYRHIRLDTNVPFYIGIGKKPEKFSTHKSEYRRAFDKNSRSRFWEAVVNKTEYKVEIIFETDCHDIVKRKEIEFIKLYGRRNLETGCLVNLSDGGDGTKGVKFIGGKTPKKQLAARNRGKTVVDMQTGIFYDSLPEACEATNCNYGVEQGRKQLNSKIARFIRAYGKEVTIDYTSRSDKVKEALRRKSKRLMLDLQTGVFFDNLPQACEAVNFNYLLAQIRLRNKSKKSRFVEIRL
jgi:hypothetical protein